MLHAISPIDGRYHAKTAPLSPYFSEYGLIRQRVAIEIEYFIKLCSFQLPQLPPLTAEQIERLRARVENFDTQAAEIVKETERQTNHDVKAVEYFVKGVLDEISLGQYREWVHFGLTSQDINNTAVPILIKNAIREIIVPEIGTVLSELNALSKNWASIPMLAHTHGQPASPTTVGKELRVFVERIDFQYQKLANFEHYGKFGGATGNFNAHLAAFPDRDWTKFADEFLASLGLQRIATSTQIDHYDHLAELLQIMVRLSTILIDLCRDIWTYISMEYFGQKTIKGETGSSTMPHKVNPIDFENAEGNLGIAIALFDHLATKLPISRLQRDLTDSTVLRNVGVPFAHVLIALKSTEKGLNKLKLNETTLNQDLKKNWMVVSEAIQTILRREGVANPYELLKDLTRGTGTLDETGMEAFIDALDISESVKSELKGITPYNYIGDAANGQ